MSKIINYDGRWIGEHGIGRFAKEVSDRNPSFKIIKSKVNPSSPLDLLYITFYLLRNEGVYFTPGYNPPLIFLKRSVITIHDLNHIDIDDNTSVLKKIYYKIILKRAAKHSMKIFTVSEFSKKRICEWAKIPQDKVIVVGNGVSTEFNCDVRPYEGEYILLVGNRKTHKNEIRAIHAFYNSNLSTNIKLIFTGIASVELNAKIKELGIEDRVCFIGRVSNSELARLYKGALLLLFPSLYEGFGLPVIEAMACGTPVITSNVTSLPEISGNAAILVNPNDVDEITKAIINVVNDEELRKKLIELGLKQAQKFTWNKTAALIDNELQNIYDRESMR